jgi:hypothetical protein
MYSRRIVTMLIVLAIFAAVAGQVSSGAPGPHPAGEARHEVVCSLPVGEQGVHYSGEQTPEMLPWGPAAFSVAPDGTFWVVDTAGQHLLHYGAGCERLADVPLGGVVGAGDVAITPAGIFVYDVAAQDPAVIGVAPDGREFARYALPLDQPITGIQADGDGALLAEYAFGAHLERLVDAAGVPSMASVPGYTHQGQIVSAQPADMGQADATRGTLQVGGRTIDVVVTHALGGLRFLGGAGDGSFYMIVEEVVVNDAIQVDQTVRHYSAKGDLLGLARVARPDQYTTVDHGLAVGPDGAVYELMTRADRVEISAWLHGLPEPDPAAGRGGHERAAASPQDGISVCVTRDTIMTTAWNIRNNQKYLSSTNTDGTCSGRGKPRYIGAAGTYRSVAYDWGGFDSLANYNAYMSPGTYKAGDINTAGVESCSRGLDCSGFVSRAWQRTTKYGTSTLYQISWQLGGTSQLLRGDVMNKAGSHVVLFESFISGGIWTLESTTTNGYDRAVYITRTWSALSTYVPRRFNNVCP